MKEVREGEKENKNKRARRRKIITKKRKRWGRDKGM
jgi:hypothetical protein